MDDVDPWYFDPDAAHDDRKPRILTDARRKYVEGCTYCESIREDTHGWGPYHDASHRCESGKHPHCTCDTCF
jgi:hypothetical protein